MKAEELQAQMRQYKDCKTEEEKRGFLRMQRERIARLSPAAAAAEIQAIADKVEAIARKTFNSAAPKTV